MTRNWNMLVHSWLKYFVMLRVMNRKAQKGSIQTIPLVITFLVSALWHGVEPGYYVFFVGLGVTDLVERLFMATRLRGSLHRNLPRPLFRALGWVWTYALVSHWGMAFVFLRWSLIYQMHLNFNFIYYKVTAVALVVCLLLPKEKRQSASKVKKPSVT